MNRIKLTVKHTGRGEGQIRARGKRLDRVVGDCVKIGSQWRARLWSRFDGYVPGVDDHAWHESRKGLRVFLEEQIAREGRWWR